MTDERIQIIRAEIKDMEAYTKAAHPVRPEDFYRGCCLEVLDALKESRKRNAEFVNIGKEILNKCSFPISAVDTKKRLEIITQRQKEKK